MFAFLCARVALCNLFVWILFTHPYDTPTPPKTDHAQSSYRVSADGSFLVSLASGMELSLTTEPLLLGGTGGGISPTASRCNISLPGDHAPSLIEWRQRKEQSKTNYSTYERRLRVKTKSVIFSSVNKYSLLNSVQLHYIYTHWQGNNQHLPNTMETCLSRADYIILPDLRSTRVN